MRFRLIVFTPLTLLLTACIPGTGPNACVDRTSSRTAGQPDIVTNDCSYVINVRYCRTPAARTGRQQADICGVKRVETGGRITSFFDQHTYAMTYAACRAPERPVASGNRYSCK